MAAHLVTLGLTDAQREILAEVAGTHVTVDLRADTTPDEYVLAVVDAVAGQPEGDRTVILFGPLAFGFACSGRMKTLGEWAELRGDTTTLAVVPDQAEPDTWLMTSEAYRRVRADLGVMLDHDEGRSWLWTALEIGDPA